MFVEETPAGDKRFSSCDCTLEDAPCGTHKSDRRPVGSGKNDLDADSAGETILVKENDEALKLMIC